MSFFLIITCSDWQARRSCVGTSPSGRGMLPSTSWGQSCPALGWEPHGGSPTPRPLVGRSRTALVRKCNAGEKKTRTQHTISILIWYELDKEQLMLMAVCLPSYLFIYSIYTHSTFTGGAKLPFLSANTLLMWDTVHTEVLFIFIQLSCAIQSHLPPPSMAVLYIYSLPVLIRFECGLAF